MCEHAKYKQVQATLEKEGNPCAGNAIPFFGRSSGIVRSVRLCVCVCFFYFFDLFSKWISGLELLSKIRCEKRTKSLLLRLMPLFLSSKS